MGGNRYAIPLLFVFLAKRAFLMVSAKKKSYSRVNVTVVAVSLPSRLFEIVVISCLQKSRTVCACSSPFYLPTYLCLCVLGPGLCFSVNETFGARGCAFMCTSTTLLARSCMTGLVHVTERHNQEGDGDSPVGAVGECGGGEVGELRADGCAKTGVRRKRHCR